jgi:ERCC4-related helicase
MGNKRPDELRQMLADTAIRRGRAEVDKLLPLLTVDTVLLPEDELEDWASYRALVDSKAGQALAQAATMDEIWTVTPHLSAARRILGELKAPAVARYVRELLEQDSEARILVFGWHRSAMARIANDLFDIEPRIRVIDGDMAGSDRDFAVARFQAGESRVLILGLATAREGITLTAANRVVFAEASWTPTQNEQAIKRAHRIGQTRPVIAQFLCIENTLDQAVMATCVRKSGLLSEIN